MDGKNNTCLLMLAAMACAATLLVVMYNINQTRLVLQESKEGAFNYIMQADRSFDRLNWKLTEYLESDSDDHQAKLWPELKLRFDVIWSTFQVFEIYLPANKSLERTSIFVDNVKTFLATNDPIFLSDSAPDVATLGSVRHSLSELSTELYEMSHDVFSSFNEYRDSISNRMETLYRFFWFSGMLLLITGTALVVQLVNLINQSKRLYDDAQLSEAQLVTVVEELRSGKLEQKAKDSFIAAASHDLRQPLHALGLFVNALETKVTSPDGSVILEKIKQCTGALSSLFNSLLDISRLDAGVVDSAPQHFYLAKLIHRLKEEFDEVATERKLVYKVAVCEEVVYADYGLLERVLRNVIDNAMSYTREGEIEVSCEQNGAFVNVTISDTGVGIPTEEQEAIFSEYYQLDNPERDRSKGLGLGLPIVRRLSTLMGIDASITSTVDVGTKVVLKIPAGDASEADSIVTPKTASTNKNFQGALVMVIDDEQPVREGMELMLSKLCCTVLSLESAEAARQAMVEQSLNPALIIADYRLRDGKTGVEAVELLRDELNIDIPSVIITGDTSPERVRATTETGMRLLHKPVQPDELIEVVESLLQPA